jgi:protein-S-isoprenylcysteine O-methyltransferase Ste14
VRILTINCGSSTLKFELFEAADGEQSVARGVLNAYVRHPQYDGFILIMAGFLLQWPTLLTLLMFPILVTMYIRLGRREEREVRVEFGEEHARYAATTPAFFPRLDLVEPNRS